jgi:hypothetical protein
LIKVEENTPLWPNHFLKKGPVSEVLLTLYKEIFMSAIAANADIFRPRRQHWANSGWVPRSNGDDRHAVRKDA